MLSSLLAIVEIRRPTLAALPPATTGLDES